MLRIYPQLRGKVDSVIESEIKNTINALYDIIENLAQKANISLEINTPNSPSTTTAVKTNTNINNRNNGTGLSNDTFSQPLLNQGDVLQTALQTIVPKSTLTSNLTITPGAVPVGGKITIITLDGKSQEVLVP